MYYGAVLKAKKEIPVKRSCTLEEFHIIGSGQSVTSVKAASRPSQNEHAGA